MFSLIDISTYIFYQSALTGINLTTFSQTDKYLSYLIIATSNEEEAVQITQTFQTYRPIFITQIALLKVDNYHYQITFKTQNITHNIEPMYNYIEICKAQLPGESYIVEEKINTYGHSNIMQNYFSILLIAAIIIIILHKRRNNKLIQSMASMIIAILIYNVLLLLVEIRFYILGQIIDHKYNVTLYLKKICMDILKLLLIYMIDIFVMIFAQENENNQNNKLQQ